MKLNAGESKYPWLKEPGSKIGNSKFLE